MMGNETTSATVATLAPFSLLFESLAKYFFGGFYETVPAGTFAAAFLAAASYLLPTIGELLGANRGSIGGACAILLMGGTMMLGGCAAKNCPLMESALAPRIAALDAKCEQAPDPINDDKCLQRDGLRAGIALCYADLGGDDVPDDPVPQ